MMLDDVQSLARVDAHDTRRVLADFTAQCRQGRALQVERASAARPRLVVLAGMGGSAAGADLLATCGVSSVEVPVVVHRGYGLPAAAGRDALVVASSYSGDTAEVISAVETAVERGIPVVAITSGGALGTLAKRHGLACVALPSGLMPRMALGLLVFPALNALAAHGVAVANEADVDEALAVVAAQAPDLVPEARSDRNEAKQLALAIGPRLPAVYGGPLTGTAAYRWKTDLEENAKLLAVAGTMPEMNHNEIEVWQGPAARTLHAVLLRHRDEEPEIARRFALVRELLTPAAGGVSEVWAGGTSRFARLLSLVHLGQWVSYYAAILRDTDPWPVPVLMSFKQRLSTSS